MYNNYYKKQIIKNILIIVLILLFAVFATHHIYYKFQKERNVDYTSSSLDIIFHEKTGDMVTLNKITPVTDSVGLSSKSYTFTVKNNLTVPVSYRIKLVDNENAIKEDNCSSSLINKDVIKVSIKGKKYNKIYKLSELEDNTLKIEKVDALEERNYTIRVWTSNDAQAKDNMHYHGLIQIVEANNDLAKAK
ncbi:MAG: hypothetical protein E7160_00600 [Firmicutes bacterium]|nr:hypothetical protein [Bacillota bacterium]